MGNLIDLTGQRFGRLVVIGRGADYLTSGGHKFARWRCKCDCGNIVLVKSVHLRNGITKSCGCISAELLEKRNRVHGMRYTKLYEVWKGMKSRCENPKHIGFKDYGGRGISVCEEWRDDFLQFYEWAVGHGYADGLTIDRIDNEKGYSPENCRWVTRAFQNAHKRNNHLIEFSGQIHTLAEWARLTGIDHTVILDRLKHGWQIARALTEKIHKK